ncbi:MAG: hypothetical protein M1823_001878 [Watsoniomyces obsoletus]|nr:MAG: hypothetical protein M1823_001878 [Watsoniomyces obsoletus]
MASRTSRTSRAASAAPPAPMPTLARTPPMSIPMRATTSRPTSSSSTLSNVSTADSTRSFRSAFAIPTMAGAGGPSQCAFPCWPDRRALDAAPEEYTSAYVSDADLCPDDDEPISSPLIEPQPEEREAFPFPAPDEVVHAEEEVVVVVCPRVRVRRPPPAGFGVVIPDSVANTSRRPSTESSASRRRRSTRRTTITATRKAPSAPTAH